VHCIDRQLTSAEGLRGCVRTCANAALLVRVRCNMISHTLWSETASAKHTVLRQHRNKGSTRNQPPDDDSRLPCRAHNTHDVRSTQQLESDSQPVQHQDTFITTAAQRASVKHQEYNTLHDSQPCNCRCMLTHCITCAAGGCDRRSNNILYTP
jgi:hypothetical protein